MMKARTLFKSTSLAGFGLMAALAFTAPGSTPAKADTLYTCNCSPSYGSECSCTWGDSIGRRFASKRFVGTCSALPDQDSYENGYRADYDMRIDGQNNKTSCSYSDTYISFNKSGSYVSQWCINSHWSKRDSVTVRVKCAWRD
ncbi:MAG: hypothetical protein ACFB3T_10290 [Geminicoccaceae bacterium]